MKLTVLLIVATILQVSANSFAQKINLKENNVLLSTVLDKIAIQSGYGIFYDFAGIKKSVSVSVDIKDATLAEALNAVLPGQELSYFMYDKTVIVSNKNAPFIPDQQVIVIHGVIKDEKGTPLPGATVRVIGTNTVALTDNNGNFSIRIPNRNSRLLVSFVGYKSMQLSVPKSGNEIATIILLADATTLEEATIVSTGYQSLPKERATGSFEKIDNQLFNRTTSTDVFTRLIGTVPSLYFNIRGAVPDRGTTPAEALIIRGLGSFSDVKPLVVIDNIPYEGNLININPNDVQDITILKDAAATSIWGTRAGNGVVVITTKKGNYESLSRISFNSNVSIYEKPDLFYLPEMNSSEFIDVEKFLFANGKYTNALSVTSPYPLFFTPVVEILARAQANLITNDEANSQIDALRKYDVRNDYLKYIYRNQVNQQYALNLNGGGKNVNYLISGGFDKNLNQIITSNNSRNTIRSSVNLRPIKGLEIQTGILYTQARYKDNNTESLVGFRQGLLYSIYPYARLADGDGNPLAPGFTYRASYLDQLSNNPNLLDWRYKPLDDMNKSFRNEKSQDILFNLGLNYKLNPVLSADLKYQYENSNSIISSLYDSDSYSTRSLVNTFTDPVTFKRSIPLGGRYIPMHSSFNTQTLRGQFNINKSWNENSQFTAIAGGEIRKNYNLTDNQGALYGYDSATKSFQFVDYSNVGKPLYYGGSAAIPYGASIGDNDIRNTSVFANASYTYKNRYIISGSIRKDASNVFGDNANKRGKPLWSTGISWDLSNEDFFKNDLLPYLRLRASYGYSGHVVNSVPAYTVVTYRSPNTITGLPVAGSSNLPNPDLRWEKIGMINIGSDFKFKNNRIGGSLEYYNKISKDLIANTPIDQTLGFGTQAFNSAELESNGIDLTLNSLNISNSFLRWNTSLIFSYSKTLVRRYLLKQGNYILNSNELNPLEGKEAYGVYAYKWAGLDPNTGDPRGYVNGQVSNDYVAISSTNISDLQYFGSAIPKYYGSLRNTFEIHGFSLSANLFYKLGYYYRRAGLNYTDMFESNVGHKEYAQRWQKPGDEKITNVPSMKYPADFNRDNFYNSSAAIIEKGDHIRLQDITAAYTFKNLKGLKNVKLYGNVSNIGIIWRANKKGLDPDITSGYPAPRIIAFGLTADY